MSVGMFMASKTETNHVLFTVTEFGLLLAELTPMNDVVNLLRLDVAELAERLVPLDYLLSCLPKQG